MRFMGILFFLVIILGFVSCRPHLGDVRTLESVPIKPELSFIENSRAKRALLRSHWHGRHTDYSLESAEHKIIRRICPFAFQPARVSGLDFGFAFFIWIRVGKYTGEMFQRQMRPWPGFRPKTLQ